MKLNPNISKISYRSGQIEGTARNLQIIKEYPREEIEKRLEQIIKWSKDIHRYNKKLLRDLEKE